MQQQTHTAQQPQAFEAHATSDFVYERVQYLAGEPFPRSGVADPVMVRRLYNARQIDWGKAPADLAAMARRRRAELETAKAAEAKAAAAAREAQELAELEAATAPAAPPAEAKQRGKQRG